MRRPRLSYKTLVKSLKKWMEYTQSGQKPDDIPASPNTVYAKSGWINWGDWLGTGRGKGNWRNFEEARAFVQKLGLKSGKPWVAYCRSGQKPNDIPAAPDTVYAESGWNGWDDWLGTGRVKVNWRNFEDARTFVQSLGLKSETEWRKYCRSGQKPDDIPAAPDRTYAESGWVDWGDWLGTGRGKVDWRNFEDARTFVHSLGFKSESEWRKYCRSGQRPADIPAKPDRVYAESGWVNWGDWLGTGRRKSGSGLRPFEEARAPGRAGGESPGNGQSY
jgi:hypothetical protein